MYNNIGIGKRKGSKPKEITFLILNRMFILNIWSSINKTPTYCYYPPTEFEFNIIGKDDLKWFVGFSVGKWINKLV